MCFAATGRLQGRAAKLLLVRWQSPGILCVRCNFALQLTSRRYVLVGVTRRKHRAESWYFSQKIVTVQGGFGACFCHPGTNFVEFWRDRGTIKIGATRLSPGTKFAEGTGAVSRYKADRSQKTVKVYRFLIASSVRVQVQQPLPKRLECRS